MTDIVTVTLNPAVDVFAAVGTVEPTRKLRCSSPVRYPGGGGVNVARVIRRLGGDCIAVYLAGGATGDRLTSMLAEEAVPSMPIEIRGETRENFTVREASSGREFRFVLPGPEVSPEEIAACEGRIRTAAATCHYLVLSGSLPAGAPADTWARIARAAGTARARIVLDTSGSALAAALTLGAWLVKPSLNELSELAGRELSTEPECIDAARAIVKRGAVEIVALTLGERGAIVVTSNQVLRAPAVQVNVRSAVGAGDSFLAGFVLAISQGEPMAEALNVAMAAAAATVSSVGNALCERKEVERLCESPTQRPAAAWLARDSTP